MYRHIKTDVAQVVVLCRPQGGRVVGGGGRSACILVVFANLRCSVCPLPPNVGAFRVFLGYIRPLGLGLFPACSLCLPCGVVVRLLVGLV